VNLLLSLIYEGKIHKVRPRPPSTWVREGRPAVPGGLTTPTTEPSGIPILAEEKEKVRSWRLAEKEGLLRKHNGPHGSRPTKKKGEGRVRPGLPGRRITYHVR